MLHQHPHCADCNSCKVRTGRFVATAMETDANMIDLCPRCDSGPFLMIQNVRQSAWREQNGL